MKFVTLIGLYPEESLLTNNIEVEISIGVPNAKIENLPFIDYGIIYQLVEQAVLNIHTTLELLLQEIYHSVAEKYKNVQQNIEVKKLTPPIKGRVNASKVSWKEF